MNPRIRSTPREQLAKRAVFARELPPTSTVWLFGSRTDLNAAGGDIDCWFTCAALPSTAN